MEEDARERALKTWRVLFARPEDRLGEEARYYELLISADHMECTGLIGADEWRSLVQEAGTAFASTAECMTKGRA